MFQLIINNKDGSLYWQEFFNSMAELNVWISEEKTRPYWNPGLTYKVIDNTPPPPSADDLAKAAAAQAAKMARMNRFKAMNITTIADVKNLLKDIVDHLGLAN